MTHISDESLFTKIYTIRGQKIMLDKDLAKFYDVPTKILNQAVKKDF
jgi:ORF6N domain